MSDNVSFLKKYFTSVLAMLIVIAIAVGSFIYSLVIGADKNVSVVIETNESGVTVVNPGEGFGPSGPPNVEPPPGPAPSN